MDQTKQTSSGGYFAKLTITLFLITAIVAGLLGFVNSITADKIAAHTAEKTKQSMQEVLPADSYDKIAYAGGDDTVAAIYQAGDAGYVVEVKPSGFGGTIDMVVGVDGSGAATGVSIISMSETSGLGANAKKESFRTQYAGKTNADGDLAVTKDGGTIDALTGATITSRAVTRGVNSALTAVSELG